MFLDRVLNFFTSLRLTVFCLACALVLVFAGTLAQVHLGLYVTQERYFHSLFVLWNPPGMAWKIPVWPGGYLLGGLLLVNLLAAHIKRFTLSKKKLGLFLIHGGLILLFVGQFLTETFQVESFMRLEEGETKNYSESARKSELAIIDVSNPDRDQVVVIPESRLAGKNEIRIPTLPFSIQVKEYLANSSPAPAMRAVSGDTQTIQASQGVGQRLKFQPQPITARMDDDNIPSALIQFSSPTGALGTWIVSNWLTKYRNDLHRMLGPQLASIADGPQQFTYEKKTYQVALRPERFYKPYSVTLLNFTHKRYRGTDIPKDFSSRVRVQNPQTGEDREVLIYMNSPLRYAGETYYQGGFEPGDKVSILQAVQNPAWLTPYFSCCLVGLGLAVHFLMHLFTFAKRNVQRSAVPGVTRKASSGPERKREAAVAAVGPAPELAPSFPVGKRRSS